MPRKKHLIVDSGCTQDNERWSLSACGMNEDSDVEWDGTRDRESVSCKRCQAQMAKPRKAPDPFHEERPILFNGAMIRSILSGQKTVTRRPIKGRQVPSRSESDSPEHQWIAVVQDHPRWGFAVFGATEEECAAELAIYGACPYGRRGDRLWVREAWAEINVAQAPGEKWVVYREHDNRTDYGGPWKPSIHMRRRDSRILLEITDVRVERLQGISEQQALAEGIVGVAFRPDDGFPMCTGYMVGPDDGKTALTPTAAEAFSGLWTSTGGDWDANPWVWVVEFKRITP